MTATGIFAEKGSFLHMLPYAAKPDDYVVVKWLGRSHLRINPRET